MKIKKIKLSKICNLTLNKANAQYSLNLRKRKMKQLKICEKDILNYYLMRNDKKKNGKK